jgi:hypothetical protein
LWRPLRAPTFRNLILADVASDMGTFMQSVGAAWLMVSLHAGPLYVALTQTASALPFFVFALPAGSIGDIVDRRKLILFTEVWMAGVAIELAAECGYRVCHQRGVFSGSHRRHRPLEAAPPPTHQSAGDPERCHRGSDPLCAVFTVGPHPTAPVRSRDVFRQRTSGPSAFGGSGG